MKVRHKKLGWKGNVISSFPCFAGPAFRILWENEYKVWKTSNYSDEIVFIVPAPTRRINNA